MTQRQQPRNAIKQAGLQLQQMGLQGMQEALSDQDKQKKTQDKMKRRWTLAAFVNEQILNIKKKTVSPNDAMKNILQKAATPEINLSDGEATDVTNGILIQLSNLAKGGLDLDKDVLGTDLLREQIALTKEQGLRLKGEREAAPSLAELKKFEAETKRGKARTEQVRARTAAFKAETERIKAEKPDKAKASPQTKGIAESQQDLIVEKRQPLIETLANVRKITKANFNDEKDMISELETLLGDFSQGQDLEGRVQIADAIAAHMIDSGGYAGFNKSALRVQIGRILSSPYSGRDTDAVDTIISADDTSDIGAGGSPLSLWQAQIKKAKEEQAAARSK